MPYRVLESTTIHGVRADGLFIGGREFATVEECEAVCRVYAWRYGKPDGSVRFYPVDTTEPHTEWSNVGRATTND